MAIKNCKYCNYLPKINCYLKEYICSCRCGKIQLKSSDLSLLVESWNKLN